MPPNHMPFFVIKSVSSTLVIMILTPTVLFSGLTRMVSMAASDSYHLRVQGSLISSVPTSIFPCSSSMSAIYLSCLSRSILCTLRRCYFWSPVTFIMTGLICPTAVSMASLSIVNSMPLVAVIFSSLLEFPFSLYASRWICTCDETIFVVSIWLTIITMSAVSCRIFATVATV